ncbi:MAG: hypothetical protein QM747_20580 [Nocardioides sp.]
MSGMTRGRLPARVYWVRRLMVLGITLLLVFGIVRMFGGSGDGGGDQARQVADTSNGAGKSTGTESDQTPSSPHHGKKKDSPPVTRVVPSGPCEASDIAITPSVPHPIGGSDITVVLDISSVSTPACSWTVSPSSLAMKITSGADLIWTTAQCSRAIPTQDVVVKQSEPTRVKVTWDARRSEPGCPVQTQWALPGTYHLYVAALGGQPQEATFLLTAPTHDSTSTKQNQGDSKHSTSGKHKKKHRQPPPG